jgi:hypothetical protein
MNARELLDRIKAIETFGMNLSNDEERTLGFINQAIMDVYPQLSFATDQLNYHLHTNQSNYTLPHNLVIIKDQYRYFADGIPFEVDRYSGTYFRKPLEDDKTVWIPMNEHRHPYGIWHNTPYELHVEKPKEEDVLLLSAIVLPDPLTLEDVDPENEKFGVFQIYPQIVNVIANRVVYLVYKMKNGHDQNTKIYWTEYMRSLDELNSNGLMNHEYQFNNKLTQKAFV